MNRARDIGAGTILGVVLMLSLISWSDGSSVIAALILALAVQGPALYVAITKLPGTPKNVEPEAQAIKTLNPDIRIVVTRDINSGFSDYMTVPEEWKVRASTGHICTLYTETQAFADFTDFAPRLAQFGNKRYNEAVADFYASAIDLAVFDGWATDGLWAGYYGGAPCLIRE